MIHFVSMETNFDIRLQRSGYSFYKECQGWTVWFLFWLQTTAALIATLKIDWAIGSPVYLTGEQCGNKGFFVQYLPFAFCAREKRALEKRYSELRFLNQNQTEKDFCSPACPCATPPKEQFFGKSANFACLKDVFIECIVCGTLWTWFNCLIFLNDLNLLAIHHLTISNVYESS